MHQTRAKLRACAARNRYLHSLLPDFCEHEFPGDDELAVGELVALEIETNLRAMYALAKELPDG